MMFCTFCTGVTQLFSTCAAKSIYNMSILILTKPNDIFKNKLENPLDFYMYIYMVGGGINGVNRGNVLVSLNDREN